MQQDYEFLGVTEDATDEEIKASYEALETKYSVDRFLDGEAGAQAARNLTRLKEAYNNIMEERKNKASSGNAQNVYGEIEKLIRDGNISAAQSKLDAFDERDAEWHYLQAMLFYNKHWMNECKKQLEIAKEMDPSNSKYANAYSKLISSANKQKVNKQQTVNVPPQNDQQMGSDGCNDACTCCQAAICADCLCQCCR